MKKTFPKAMKGIDAETLFLIFNKSEPGLIRVESSELYYNFHIIIRYEIEEMIFNQGLNAKDIPKIWKQKYKPNYNVILNYTIEDKYIIMNYITRCKF